MTSKLSKTIVAFLRTHSASVFGNARPRISVERKEQPRNKDDTDKIRIVLERPPKGVDVSTRLSQELSEAGFNGTDLLKNDIRLFGVIESQFH